MTSETIFEKQAVSQLASYLKQWGSQRVLLIMGPSRRFEDVVRSQLEQLGGLAVEVYAGAKVHVPLEVVQEAKKLLQRFQPDTLITLGGGAATGLGKVLRLEHACKFVAIPTTYAGSEMTSIYGTTESGHKKTGRRAEVRPDLVLYDPELTATLPRKQTVTSLLNALAHPIAALQDPELEAEMQAQALEAIETLCLALDDLLEAPSSQGARLEALRGAAMAGRVLDQARLGSHHRLVHLLGGCFNLDHSDLHALLLPHTLRQLALSDPDIYARIEAAAGVPDLPAVLFDSLTRAGAPTALKSLGLSAIALQAALAEEQDQGLEAQLQAQLQVQLQAAYLGRRPSLRVRHQDWGFAEPVSLSGPNPAEARLTVVAVHGRNSQADAMIKRIDEVSGNAADIAVIAPQASENSWYSGSYHAPLADLEPQLTQALEQLDQTLIRVLQQVAADQVVLFGFSQGACLVTEYLARRPQRFAGLIALAGARIGESWAETDRLDLADLADLPIVLGVAEADPWVRQADVDKTAAFLSAQGAKVRLTHSRGDAHTMTLVQCVLARELLLDQPSCKGHRGFGQVVESEALPGALPLDQNSPLHTPYGLYAEQLNGTGFVAERHHNLRSWLYRIRPSAQHSPFVSQKHARFCQDFQPSDANVNLSNPNFSNPNPINPNLLGYGPLPIPDQATDFIAGLCTFGGAGSPALRRGFAIHLYAANRSMEQHAFYNSDGDFLIVPQLGTLLLQTEMGVLELPPGHIGILPRGVKFSVMLKEGMARGYVAEVFGRHFELPERGPVGANGLAEARHFVAPQAWHEDRLAPGYRLSTKFCGQLFEATQDHSPYDVVAWHGNYTPYVYDLMHFSPVSSARFDHPDPSIYTVLTAPLDEQGSHSLDFVYFPPRWDVTEHTFRPPFFHRNATTEFNGIVKDPTGNSAPFYAGGYFLTPSMTAHGIRNRGVERTLKAPPGDPQLPMRLKEDALWFQFETALPLQLTAWALSSSNRIEDWHQMWGAYRSHFKPG